MTKDGQNRVIIESVTPEIDGGKYPARRVVGQSVWVEADIFADGHDVLQAEILYKAEKDKTWQKTYLKPTVNDRWAGKFKVEKQGIYQFKIEAWVDWSLTWQHNIERKIQDGQNVKVELLDGIQYLEALKKAVPKPEGKIVATWIELFKDESRYAEAIQLALSHELHDIFYQYPLRQHVTVYDNNLRVYVDRKKALFSTWYEFFPRSSSLVPGKHGTFKECEHILPRIAEMGFDVLYFPPIHPIGIAHRKGKNNSTIAETEDVGSPWAIGAPTGGHKDILGDLGTLADFKHLIQVAKKEYNIEIAMDYALQCSPDHPYVKAHPQWFRWRPDGTVQYAENPPKKYQDILPINFETEDWQNLWNELLSILIYWCEQGITIFRVDNPHTKAFLFWEWAIAEVKKKFPDTLFLSEAFTRPRVMHKLAKIGFTQSYTYYTWRNNKKELTEYMIELSQGLGKEYFRPNFWPNTPDINPWDLQDGNEAKFLFRYFMAATLSSNYGMYGPVYEYMIHAPYPFKEEYLDSEKYEVKNWDWTKTNTLIELIKRTNKARQENAALQETNNITMCNIDDEQMIAYFKQTEDKSNSLFMVVNMDPYNQRWARVQLPLHLLGGMNRNGFVMHDLITGQKYHWREEWNVIGLSPSLPVHLFRVELP
ncbi:MAG: alpha-1,4-glucan--maltose-1-phosphate maltosyltransferase [Microscillaceae bacterium]|nr:alpha-1,4-glucan--maltose-1-phosphate maltosyltransferase [Microscillaceae bacterium]